MIVLGFDTATRSTAVALRMSDGSTVQRRDDPSPAHPGSHPGHATRLLAMANELLKGAELGWSALDRIAVGLGPGTFTGLRVGVATARGLAQSLEIELVGVSSLRALAAGASMAIGQQVGPQTPPAAGILAVLDARRGEAFAAAYLIAAPGSTEELVPPGALPPEELGHLLAQAQAQIGDTQDRRWWAVGDGATRFRSRLEESGAAVPPDSSPLHLLSAEAICDLGADTNTVVTAEAIVPDYRRRPDAELALEDRHAAAVVQVSERDQVEGDAKL